MPPPPPHGALPLSERIEVLDTLRGVALLGILIMNMPGFSQSFFAEADGSHLWPGRLDQWAEQARNLLFSGKFNSMFSLLFGIGFTLQFARMQARDAGSANQLYLQRLGVLWLFLITPAITAAYVKTEQAFEVSNNLAYGKGSFLDSAAENLRVMVFTYTDPLFLWGTFNWYVMLAMTMLIGLLAGRKRWAQRIPELLPQIRRLPLTNYLMQTAICITLFNAWGFGLWGSVGPAAGLLLALFIFFAVQVPWSLWWLRRHERGPLEALWARLTYGAPREALVPR